MGNILDRNRRLCYQYSNWTVSEEAVTLVKNWSPEIIKVLEDPGIRLLSASGGFAGMTQKRLLRLFAKPLIVNAQ
jgi:hypothetical protein